MPEYMFKEYGTEKSVIFQAKDIDDAGQIVLTMFRTRQGTLTKKNSEATSFNDPDIFMKKAKEIVSQKSVPFVSEDDIFIVSFEIIMGNWRVRLREFERTDLLYEVSGDSDGRIIYKTYREINDRIIDLGSPDGYAGLFRG